MKVVMYIYILMHTHGACVTRTMLLIMHVTITNHESTT